MKNYALLLLPLSGYRVEFRQHLFEVTIHHYIRSDEIEILYDWTINQCLNQILVRRYNGGVENHYQNDLYRCFYDNAGIYLERYFESLLSSHEFRFVRNERIKTLVAGDTLIIARGIPEHVRL